MESNNPYHHSGQPYPIHPLDLTTPVILPYTEDGVKKNTTVCVNNYEYFTLDPASFSVDAFLGDAFLRNVYASFDYGDYDPATKKDGQPFVQLLSTTKQDAAWAEFQSARAIALKSLPPTIDPKDLFNPNSSSDATNKTGDGTVNDAGSGNTHVRVSGVASDTDGEDSDLTSLVKKYGPIVIGLLAGNLIVGLLLFLVGLAVCVKGIIKGGAKTRTMGSAYVPVSFKDEH